MAEVNAYKGLAEYTENFDSVAYLEQNSSIHREFVKSCAGLLHETFSTLEPGERLLDVGSGPGLKNVISASSKFQDITLSDPLPQNRRLLQKYMDDVTEDQRWTEHFKLTAELEGDAQKWPEVRDRMRARIKRIVWCDILQDEPLGKGQPEELYDCVTATLCLYAATADGDVSTYRRAVKNLISLVKTGGFVIIAEAISKEGCSYYSVGGRIFSALNITAEEVCDSVQAAGCEVLSFIKTRCALPYEDEDHTTEFIYALKARKL